MVTPKSSYDRAVRRWIFRLAILTSVALTLAVLVLWVRSYRQQDVAALDLANEHYEAWTDPGLLTFETPRPPRQGETIRLGNATLGASLVVSIGHGTTLWRVSLDFWLITVLTGAVGFAWTGKRLFLVVRNRGNLPTGFCSNCGYDLRASPDRCPECGAHPRGQERGRKEW